MEVGKGEAMWIERNFTWGGGCMMQCADNVFLSCTLETCMVL